MSEKVFEWATDHWKNSQCNRFRVKCGGKPQTRTLPVVWSDFLLPWSYCWSITSSSVQVTSLKKSNKSYRDVRQNFLSWDMIHPKGDTPVITEHDYDSKWQLLSDLPGAALGNLGYWMLISLIWIQKYRFVLKKEGKCTIFGLKKTQKNSWIAILHN